jgi:hypothetical protein
MFQKGQSGNPAGPAKGTRHKITMLAEKLMAADVETIVAAVLTAARNGDMAAAKIILDRIAPVRRSRAFALPAVTCEADKAKAHEAVLDAVANGDLMPGEIRDVCRLIDRVARECGRIGIAGAGWRDGPARSSTSRIPAMTWPIIIYAGTSARRLECCFNSKPGC